MIIHLAKSMPDLLSLILILLSIQSAFPFILRQVQHDDTCPKVIVDALCLRSELKLIAKEARFILGKLRQLNNTVCSLINR